MSTTMGRSDTIVIADAHIDGLNDQLRVFLSFLSQIQKAKPHSLIILGDLFNIWLGDPRMRLSHQKPLLDALQGLRNRGIHLIYVEGNRDYFLAPWYVNAPFDRIASDGIDVTIGKSVFYFSHGDLVNIHDIQYRLWRRCSRNRLVFALFKHLPHTLAIRFAHFLEQTFRETNTQHKIAFPQHVCQHYAEKMWQQGYDVIILGHFHEERTLESTDQNRAHACYILPAWKDSHVYLQISMKGEIQRCRFTPS